MHGNQLVPGAAWVPGETGNPRITHSQGQVLLLTLMWRLSVSKAVTLVGIGTGCSVTSGLVLPPGGALLFLYYVCHQ